MEAESIFASNLRRKKGMLFGEMTSTAVLWRADKQSIR
jgi:hypothetical protein